MDSLALRSNLPASFSNSSDANKTDGEGMMNEGANASDSNQVNSNEVVVNGQKMTVATVMHFIQHEWNRFELERSQWECDKAELEAKIAYNEGERRSQMQIVQDLVRRCRMLEYCLVQERTKSKCAQAELEALKTGKPLPAKQTTDASNREKQKIAEDLKSINKRLSIPPPTLDKWNFKESRLVLKKYINEIGLTEDLINFRAARSQALFGKDVCEKAALSATDKASEPSRVSSSSAAARDAVASNSSEIGGAFAFVQTAANDDDKLISSESSASSSSSEDDDDDEDFNVDEIDQNHVNGKSPNRNNAINPFAVRGGGSTFSQKFGSNEDLADVGAADEEEALKEFNFLSDSGAGSGESRANIDASGKVRYLDAIDGKSGSVNPDIWANVDQEKIRQDMEIFKQERKVSHQQRVNWKRADDMGNADGGASGAGNTPFQSRGYDPNRGNALEAAYNISMGNVQASGSRKSDTPLSAAESLVDKGVTPAFELDLEEDMTNAGGEDGENVSGYSAVGRRSTIKPRDAAGCEVGPVGSKQFAEQYCIAEHLDAVRKVVFHPTDMFFATASDDGSVKLFSMWNVPIADRVEIPRAPGSLFAHKKFIRHLHDTLLDGNSIESIVSLRHKYAVTQAAFSSCGKLLFTGDIQGMVSVWDAEYFRTLWKADSIPTQKCKAKCLTSYNEEAVSSLVVIEGRNLLLCTSTNGLINLIEWNEGLVDARELTRFTSLTDFVMQSNGGEEFGALLNAHVIESSPLKVVLVYQFVIMRAVLEINGKFGVDSVEPFSALKCISSAHAELDAEFKVVSSVFLDKPQLVVVGHANGKISAYDVDSGSLKYQWTAHSEAVVSLDIDTTGLELLSGSSDGSVRLWKTDTRKCFKEITAHRSKFKEGVMSVRFMNGQAVFASSGADGCVKVFG